MIAEWGEADVARLLGNAGIIRHRGKIEATIGNARAWQEIEAREGFDRFLWNYVDGTPLRTTIADRADMPTQSPLSAANLEGFKKGGLSLLWPDDCLCVHGGDGVDQQPPDDLSAPCSLCGFGA